MSHTSFLLLVQPPLAAIHLRLGSTVLWRWSAVHLAAEKDEGQRNKTTGQSAAGNEVRGEKRKKNFWEDLICGIGPVLVCRSGKGGRARFIATVICDKVTKIRSLPRANFRPRSARREECHHEGESVGESRDAHDRLTLLVRSGC
jgi:hypothetical protein